MKESKGNDINCIKIKMYQYNLLKTIIDTFLMIHYNIKYYFDLFMKHKYHLLILDIKT